MAETTLTDTFTLFFYGTLLAPPVLYRVIFGTNSPSPLHHPSLKSLVFRSALLRDHRRHRVLDADYPAILPESGGTVRGTVVSGLTEGDRWRLDVFEGTQYERRTVNVRAFEGLKLDEAADINANEEGEEVEAETYVWLNSKDELDQQEWDFEEFKRDKMRAWMGDGSSWSDDEDDATQANVEGVKVDEGFADVDRAVAEQEARKAKENGNGNGHVKDPTGGRGANGHITKQLKEVQENGKIKPWNTSADDEGKVQW